MNKVHIFISQIFFIFLVVSHIILCTQLQDKSSNCLSPLPIRFLPLSFSYMRIARYHWAGKFITYTQGMLIICSEIN